MCGKTGVGLHCLSDVLTERVFLTFLLDHAVLARRNKLRVCEACCACFVCACACVFAGADSGKSQNQSESSPPSARRSRAQFLGLKYMTGKNIPEIPEYIRISCKSSRISRSRRRPQQEDVVPRLLSFAIPVTCQRVRKHKKT